MLIYINTLSLRIKRICKLRIFSRFLISIMKIQRLLLPWWKCRSIFSPDNKHPDKQTNENLCFLTNPVADILCWGAMKAMINFHFHFLLLRLFFQMKTAFVMRTKAINQSHWEALSSVTDIRHFWDSWEWMKCPSVSDEIFYTFTVSDIGSPCHPINVTNFKRPLHIYHSFVPTYQRIHTEITLMQLLWGGH